MNKYIYIIIFCLFSSFGISQQVSIDVKASAGDIAHNRSLKAEWTLGEIIVESFDYDKIILDQGFHQGYYFILPPDTLIVENLIIHPSDSECFAALSYIEISDLTVEPGGDVTFIAGNSITFSDHVIVKYGGVLHAKISENGEYCENHKGLLNSPDNIEYDSFEQPLTKPLATNNQFIIFPNPTKHYLNIKANNIYHGAPLLLEVYSLTGDKVESMIMTTSSATVDLSALKAGMYIIRIYHDNDIWISKIGKL
ncbi:MAG: T9SS type A sorting domain-containing protein [Bacteroidales bacterium]